MEELHMLENHMIQQKGFTNVSALGQVAGFQVRVRQVAYKGHWLYLIGGAEVTVDGEAFPRNQITWTFREKTFTQDELLDHQDIHWHWTEPATLTISKPGGLKTGNHKVRVVVSFLEGTARRCAFTREMILA
jgi:hypothetical protein